MQDPWQWFPASDSVTGSPAPSTIDVGERPSPIFTPAGRHRGTFATLLACHGVHRPPVPRAGQTARPGNRKGSTMTEAAVSFAGNLTDQPELGHTESGIAGAVFRV